MSTTAVHAPTLLERTHGAVTVAWPAAAHSDAKYELQMQKEGEEWATLSDNLGTNLARKRNLDPSSRYAFRVRAGRGSEWSDWSSASEQFSPLAEHVKQMRPPVMLSANGDSISIKWDPVPGATGYRLRFRSTADVSWTEIGATITNTTAKKKNLARGTGYVFAVIPVGVEEEEYEFSLGSEVLHVTEESAVTFVGANNQTFTSSAVRNKVVGLYFSAHWCPPCRRFTPQLAELYKEAQTAGLPFEILFVSADNSPREFREYLNEMPWKAYDFEDPNREKLQDAYQVTGIPRLVILKPDGSIIDNNAVGKPLSLGTIRQWVQQAGL